MRFNLELDRNIFYFLTIIVVTLVITIFASGVAGMFMDYEYYKKKLDKETGYKPAITREI